MTRRRRLELIALILPTLATAFFWFMLIGSALGPEEDGGSAAEVVAVLGAAIVLAAATLVAWLRRRWGAPALIAAAAFVATIIATTAGTNVLTVAVILPLPWLVGGLLLLSAVGRPRARGRPAAPSPESGSRGGNRLPGP
jgi:hypothetical protein